MVPMPTIDEKDGATALMQALKSELSAADWPREGSVVEVSFLEKLPVGPILIWAVLAPAFSMVLK